MNVIEIIRAHLEQIGADGLCGGECGCEAEDMCPCGNDMTECVPAKNNREKARREASIFWMEPMPDQPQPPKETK